MPSLPFDYTLTRSRRRTTAIYVREHGVEVRAPLRASRAAIHRFVQTKSEWVLRQLTEQKQRATERLVIRHNAAVTLAGRSLRLRLRDGDATRVVTRPGELHLTVPEACPVAAHELFLTWLKAQAEEILTVRTRRRAETLGLLSRLQRVRCRYTRSQWGHCTARGVIQYNPLILLAPTEVRDYLVTHEVCHLRHPNHSRAYWRLVADACPDYARAEQWLRENGHRLHVVASG